MLRSLSKILSPIKELIDYHDEEMIEEDNTAIKKKRKVLAGMMSKLKRNHTFYCTSRYAGKGV